MQKQSHKNDDFWDKELFWRLAAAEEEEEERRKQEKERREPEEEDYRIRKILEDQQQGSEDKLS